MTAKQCAVRDIEESLSKEGKVFIAFFTELDPIMDTLVNNQIELQKNIK